MTTSSPPTETRAARYELAILIEAPASEVWRAIIEDTDGWWISELRCVGPESTVTLEARAGGQLIENQADGASLLWFTVIEIAPQVSLNLAGHLAPPYGGPATTYLRLHLIEEASGADARTRVELTSSMHGAFDEDTLQATAAGWRMLLEEGLKPHVETAQR